MKRAKGITGKLDDVFSRYIRLKAGGYCKRCWMMGREKLIGYASLANCHFHTRNKHSVRWDEDNVAALCSGCHRYIDDNPYKKIEFWLELIGEDRLAALDKRAENLQKVDKDKLLCYYKERLKEVE